MLEHFEFCFNQTEILLNGLKWAQFYEQLGGGTLEAIFIQLQTILRPSSDPLGLILSNLCLEKFIVKLVMAILSILAAVITYLNKQS